MICAAPILGNAEFQIIVIYTPKFQKLYARPMDFLFLICAAEVKRLLAMYLPLMTIWAGPRRQTLRNPATC